LLSNEKLIEIDLCFAFRFWGIKYLVLIGITVGAFFIPEDSSFGEGLCQRLAVIVVIIDVLVLYE
jgi:hypothetical protein